MCLGTGRVSLDFSLDCYLVVRLSDKLLETLEADLGLCYLSLFILYRPENTLIIKLDCKLNNLLYKFISKYVQVINNRNV